MTRRDDPIDPAGRAPRPPRGTRCAARGASRRPALRILVLGLLAASLAVSACGKKGDPHRPGEAPKTEKKAS